MGQALCRAILLAPGSSSRHEEAEPARDNTLGVMGTGVGGACLAPCDGSKYLLAPISRSCTSVPALPVLMPAISRWELPAQGSAKQEPFKIKALPEKFPPFCWES